MAGRNHVAPGCRDFGAPRAAEKNHTGHSQGCVPVSQTSDLLLSQHLDLLLPNNMFLPTSHSFLILCWESLYIKIGSLIVTVLVKISLIKYTPSFLNPNSYLPVFTTALHQSIMTELEGI